MRVVLFRHGPAGERDPLAWPDDRERPLTEKGEARTSRAARGILWLEGEPTLVLSSPLRRAIRTAELFAEEAGGACAVETLAALAPGESWRPLLQRLAQAGPEDTLVLVGHEPDLGKLAGVLLLGAPAALPLKKAGACAFRFEDTPAPGAGQLRWWLPPRVLQRLAPSRSRV